MRALFLVISLTMAGCASNTAPSPDAESNIGFQFANEYLVGIGDALNIDVWRHDDISTNVTVRPDGKVTVPIAGEIMVGGKTPETIGKEIAEKLTNYIREPIVTVSVGGFGEDGYLTRVRITGAVGSPQSLPYRQGMTVMDVVLDAGGPSEFASPSGTILYRRDGTKLNVRLDRILRKGDLTTNYPIRPGDVVTVPERLF